MLNKVILIGNLGADPEIRTTESGASVASFRIACNDPYKDKDGNWQDGTEWITITAWHYLADRAQKRLKKGTTISVEGKFTTRKWVDGHDQTRYSSGIQAKKLLVLKGGIPADNARYTDEDAPPNYAVVESNKQPTAAVGAAAGAGEGSDEGREDLPF
jgi:single-strand DNA-binding protein